jgi:peptidyl-prolyl cis-trans isomerase B (cyclophilin B)
MQRKQIAFLLVVAAVVVSLPLLVGHGPSGSSPSSSDSPSSIAFLKKRARIKTSYGDMVARFFPDVAPRTVKNFCDLAQKGFYNGLVFHRVVRGFMIQGGDPQGTGLGGPGYMIKAEFSNKPHLKGTLSMARSSSPDSAGSQFFIVHADHADHLDGKYTVFGELVSGLDVLDKIATAPVSGERPLVPVKMESVTIEDEK